MMFRARDFLLHLLARSLLCGSDMHGTGDGQGCNHRCNRCCNEGQAPGSAGCSAVAGAVIHENRCNTLATLLQRPLPAATEKVPFFRRLRLAVATAIPLTTPSLRPCNNCNMGGGGQGERFGGCGWSDGGGQVEDVEKEVCDQGE